MPTGTPEATPMTEQQVETYLDETPPGSEPVLFRPGSVSTGAIELSLAIHPNLQEVYFTRLESGKATIMVSRQTDDGWTAPEPASFSGEYDDVNPFVSADGKRLYFASTRSPDGQTHIWVTERDGNEWSTPTRLTLPLESANGESSPSLTRDGTLYYVADYPELGGNGLYRAQLSDGTYQTPEKIDLLVDTGEIVEVEPFVAPDESFVLFYSAGRPDNLMPNGRTGDIYIAFRDGQGQWSAPRNVGVPVSSSAEESTPTLSPDGQYLFFASNRTAGQRFPDLYWIDAAFLQTLEPVEISRDGLPLSANDLMHGFDFDRPVDEAALTPPVQAATPLNTFEGRLELLGEPEGGHVEMVCGQLEPDHRYLPEFDFAFVQSDGYLIPVQRGQIIAEHPLWNLILEPGRVWQEAGDGDYSRASLPFALITKGNNATFNGTLTFLFNAQSVSKVWYQITQETTSYTRANLWGLLDATYYPGPVDKAEQIRADFAAELAARLPTKLIEALAEDYPDVDVSAFGRGVTPAHMTWYGVMVNGVNYVGGCQTRFGTYPYCESMRATSYSTAKSAFVSVALMRLAQKYGAEVANLLIKAYVPEYAASSGDWESVTYNHTIDMSTGNYFSDGFMADDTGAKMNEFYGAQPYSARITAAFTAPNVAAPGKQWVYRTSDTFILTRAMHNYLQSREGLEADIYQFVVNEVYRPLGLGPGVYTTMRTADDNWQGQAEGGYGTWWIPDDIAKLALLLNNNGGQINGEQVLHPALLAATMQRDPADRGVKIDRRQMYNNAFWATHYTESDGFDCEFWITEMQGVSGNVVALFPNGITYYYFSDNQEFTWDAALRESDKMIPLCVTAQTPTPMPQATAPAVKNLRESIDFSTGKGPVYSQDWSPDGRLLVTADYDQVLVWDIEARREAGVLEGHTDFVWGLRWSPDGSVLASASQDGTVRLWDMATYNEIAALQTGWAFCVDWSPDGKTVVVGNRTGRVQLWDVETRQLLDSWQGATPSIVISVDWSPDGKTVAAGEFDGNIVLWDVATGKARLTLAGYTSARRDVNGLAWSPDGQLLATAHQDGQVRLWDGATGELVRAIDAHRGWARGVAWSPDGKWLVSTGEDKRICLWDPETGSEYAEHHNRLPVWSAAWSPDGTKVASGGGGYEQPHVGATIVWAVPTEPSPTVAIPASLALSAPPGNPPVLDGQISAGEWDGALRQEFTDGGELLLMHSDGYLYVAVRTNFTAPADVVSAVCLARGDQVFILHSSASLGTAVFQRDGAQWQATQTFDWALNELSEDPAEAEQQRQIYLAENRWLATLGTATTTGEVEYQIAVPEEQFSLAMAYLLPPRTSRLEAAWWPANLADDCRKISLLQGDSGQGKSTPLRLKFAPETWVTVDLSK